MSASSWGQRATVFVLFASLCAAAAAALVPVVPVASPSAADLAALETRMTAGARLHVLSALPDPVGPASWCAQCHPGLPHPGGGVAPAMLNEHAARMDCLLCHWSAANGARPAPAWQVPSGAASFLTVIPLERSSKEQLAALRVAATVARRCFERGPACAGCHRPGGIGALARSGSPPSRVDSLERLDRYFTVVAGEKWYFPRIQ